MNFISITLFCLLIAEVKSIANVLCIGGYGDQPLGLMKVRCNEIAKKYPGTKIYYINTGSMYGGARPVWILINEFMDKVKEIARENPNGINLIGYSLGGILARSYIELVSELKVLTFVSANSPILGIYPKAPSPNLWSRFEKLLFWDIFNPVFQIVASELKPWSDFMHDPTSSTPFQTDFLPFINNFNDSCSSCKANFLKVRKFVLVGAESDGNDIPWFTEHGAFYDKHLNVVPLEKQPMYHTLGWKTLIDEGRLLRLSIPNVGHTSIMFCKDLFEKYITKYLQ